MKVVHGVMLFLAVCAVVAAISLLVVFTTPRKKSSTSSIYVASPTAFLESTSFTLHDDGSQEMATVELDKSREDTLVTLVLLAANGRSFQPVGRSYDGNDWEASAGAFAGKVSVDCGGEGDDDETTASSSCLVSLPGLPNDGSVYQLTLFDKPKYTGRDEVARFLEQATFGGTRGDIDALLGDRQSPPWADFAGWIQRQQTEAPMMSHRAIYRRHLNAQFPVPSPMGGVTLPCRRDSRYRLTAFSIKDIDRQLTVQSLNGTSNAKKALLLDGNLRTVVGRDIYMYNEDWELVPVPSLKDGTYRLCWVYEEWEAPKRELLLMYHPDSGECVVVFFQMSSSDLESNPSVELVEVPDLLGNITPPIILDIAVEDAAPIDVEFHQGYEIIEQDIILQTNLGNCPELDPNSETPVFVRWKNRLYIHDPRFVLLDNDIESPLEDGGGDVASEFADPYQPGFTARCANVPRNFVNEYGCYLSDSPLACPYDNSDPHEYGGDKGNFPYTPIEVNSQLLQAIYNVTGAGEPGTVYLYAIGNLQIARDPQAEPPCQPGSVSRWISMPCTGQGPSVAVASNQLIGTIISYYRQETENTNLLDIYHPEQLEFTCDDNDLSAVGFEVADVDDSELCWRNVHIDLRNVYDFTSWTIGHPGNSAARNPIKEVAEVGNTTLYFPLWHDLAQWNENKLSLEGGYIKLGDIIDFYDLPEELVSQELANAIGIDLTVEPANGVPHGPTIVCGSPFEIANDPLLGGSQENGAFDATTKKFQTSYESLRSQRHVVWMKAVLEDPGQLRQRVAWALSQILVIAPSGIDDGTYLTEAFVNYYDIFVRNAFGNYRDVLREVAYSPMMADMLTYLDMKSTVAAWEEDAMLSFADENFAREVLQLFTTGLFPLNDDGTKIGNAESVYTNDDIEEYARAWTGFVRRGLRGNIEESYGNRIDPMQVVDDWRDRSPKMGLNRQYVGDGYPLCADLPRKHFLAKGAKYVLIGSSPRMESQRDPSSWLQDESNVKHLSLNPASELYTALCSSSTNGECAYKTVVQLSNEVSCYGIECEIDTIRAVQVDGVFYEYVQPVCVQQTYFNNPRTIVRKVDGIQMCGDPRVESAATVCCGSVSWEEIYWGERTKFDTSIERCFGDLCSQFQLPDCGASPRCDDNGFFWTSAPCTLQVKVGDKGKIAVVHQTGGFKESIDPLVRDSSQTFFRADWEGAFPGQVSECGAIEACATSDEGFCICEISVMNEPVFLGPSIPSRGDILRLLQIGASKSSSEPNIGGDVNVYNVGGDGSFTIDTVFEFFDDNGVQHRRKNLRSIVEIKGTDFRFRNPPHFVSFAAGEVRDAQYETEAVLDHYFYHPNTAPFLAVRFAQRFGISNPSPRYVKVVVNAFRGGFYHFQDKTFGTGEYGDLSATIAAILLDREARNTILDSDPMHGSFKEPLLKVMSLLRSLEFQLNPHSPFVEFSATAGDLIGQMAHYAPSVFSFFLSEHRPSGRVSQSSLVAPEAQVLTGPRIIDGFNGIFSLIKYGLTPCFGGFGEQEEQSYCKDLNMGKVVRSLGALTYRSDSEDSPTKEVDELATLLTAGRLSSESRRLIVDRYSSEPEDTALLIAQMMVAASPEFHVTNLVRQTEKERDPKPPSKPRSHPYKAVINIQLQGGVDSYNLLAPHSCSVPNVNGLTLLQQYNNERTSIAFTDDERTRIVDATNQPCEQFAIHPDLPIVESLYKEGSLAFFANIGQLDTPVTKDDYYTSTRTELFAHNTMQLISQSIDPWDEAAGTGILGRFGDVLSVKGYNTQPITIAEETVATAGVPGEGKEPLIVSSRGLSEFAPRPDGEEFNIKKYLPSLNNATRLHSSIYGETWSDRLNSAVGDSELLWGALSNVTLTQSYSTNEDTYVPKIKALTSLMLTYESRETDRDLFWLSLGEWDHHEDLKRNLAGEFQLLNEALTLLVQELKAQNLFANVTVVITSDFGRTLTANSGTGSDHAWGGNLFAFGGSVKGGQILGEYPADITFKSPLNVGRGRLIPTLSWESMFNGVAEWLGIDTEEELNYCMPNRQKTGTPLFSKNDIFHDDSSVSRGLQGIAD